MKTVETQIGKKYDKIAEYYHMFRTKDNPKGWFYNEFLEMPATFRLLGNVKGKKILDFGCGSGIYAKRLTEKGAIVRGFDVSKKMVKIAKKENLGLDIRYGSGYKIPFNESFDIVIASLVMCYLKDWDKVFKQVYHILKKGGYFIFSIGNPVSESSKRINVNNKSYKVVGIIDYFNEGILYSNWRIKDKDIKMP